jgi:flagellar FliJ protein
MAGKFKYRLEKVLAMRQKREETLKQELSDAQRIEKRAREHLDELTAQQTLGQRNLGSNLQAGSGADVQRSNDYLNVLKDKVGAQEKVWKSHRDSMNQADERYRKAQRDLEIVKKHKEKNKERWQDEEKRLEGIRSDEMASNMFQAKVRRQRADDEEEAAYEEALQRAEQGQRESEAMLAESSWMQGFLSTAAAEAERLGRSNAS